MKFRNKGPDKNGTWDGHEKATWYWKYEQFGK
jgi:hypothetical protein